MTKTTMILLAILLLGATLRLSGLWRPVDTPSWRECDIAGIARNYYRDGMDLFYPRIDWRGDGPGYAEMELPILSWTTAGLYKLFGYDDSLGRAISYVCSILTLFVFLRLSQYLFSSYGSIAAFLFFALHPLVIQMATALQGEALMLLLYVSAAYSFLRWIHEDSEQHYWLALISTAGAVLAKATAGHIGLLFAALLLQKRGCSVVRDRRAWMFAFLSLLPGAMWYLHAHTFWVEYGLSLGVSNESHFAGWDLFTTPGFIVGILRQELNHVWMPTGILVGALGVWHGWSKKEVRYGLLWLGAAFAYYLIIARTSGDDWSYYYHVVSVAPAAILFGSGVAAIEAMRTPRFWGFAAALVIAGAAFLVASDLWASRLALVAVTAGVALVAIRERFHWNACTSVLGSAWVLRAQSFILAAGVILAVWTLLAEARRLTWDPESFLADRGLYACAQQFKPALTVNGLIIASGGPCKDPDGSPVAYNASYMFYWLDRKGFNICEEEQSIDTVAALANRGAQYFVAEKVALAGRPALEQQLRQTYAVVGECPLAVVFRVAP